MKENLEGKENNQRKYLEVGFVGPIGAGKTTISEELGRRWNLNPVQENYPENPFLEKFYEDPQSNSFKSQLFFLTEKIRQLAENNPNEVRIIDPALMMDYLYAKTHHEMGWMDDPEWNTYQSAFYTLVESQKIKVPDMYIIVNADPESLKKGIKNRNRPYEMWILNNYPEYITKLSEEVRKWGAMKENGVVKLGIDSTDICENGKDPNVRLQEKGNEIDGIDLIASRIEIRICLEFGLENKFKLPSIPREPIKYTDHFPGASSEEMRFKR